MAEDLKYTYLDEESKEIVKQFDSLELVENEDARKFRAKLCEELSKLTHIRKTIKSFNKDMSANPICEKRAKEDAELLTYLLKPQYSCPHGDWYFAPCDDDCTKCKKLQEKYEFADVSKISRAQVHSV